VGHVTILIHTATTVHEAQSVFGEQHEVKCAWAIVWYSDDNHVFRFLSSVHNRYHK